MPMPSKGTRLIDVRGVRYRFAGTAERGDVRLVVEREEGGRRLLASFDPFVLHGRENWAERLGKGLVRIAIVEALSRGWRPAERGSPFVLREPDIFGDHRTPDWAERAGVPRQLLDAVLDQPDDDRPRRVLADWLVERGDPRGTFIHQQCDGEAGTELMERFWRRWSAPAWPAARRWRFGRGFVEHVSLREAPEPGAWEALHRIEPVRTVELTVHAPPAPLDWLVRPTHREVVLHGPVGAGLAGLWSSPWLGRLRRLSLRFAVDDDTALGLADCPALGGLDELDLRDNRVGPVGAAALARSPHLARIRVLHLPSGRW